MFHHPGGGGWRGRCARTFPVLVPRSPNCQGLQRQLVCQARQRFDHGPCLKRERRRGRGKGRSTKHEDERKTRRSCLLLSAAPLTERSPDVVRRQVTIGKGCHELLGCCEGGAAAIAHLNQQLAQIGVGPAQRIVRDQHGFHVEAAGCQVSWFAQSCHQIVVIGLGGHCGDVRVQGRRGKKRLFNGVERRAKKKQDQSDRPVAAWSRNCCHSSRGKLSEGRASNCVTS